MKYRLSALLLALVLALSLAACSTPAADNTGSPSGENTGAPSTDGIVADLSQDVMTFAAGDLAKEEYLLTVNGEKIPAARFLYWLAYSCNYFETNYTYYYGFTVADYADMILSDAVSISAYNTLLDQQAKALGCILTDEQRAAIVETMQVGTKDHEQRMELFGLPAEDLMLVYSSSYFYDNLMAATIPAPTEEDLNNYVYHVKHILFSLVDREGTPIMKEDGTYGYPPLDEETIAEKRALAADVLAQLQAAPAEELEALFDQLMHEHSEDGRDEAGNLGAPDGYTTTPGKMVPEFEEASFALGFGELSGLVESDYGLHIILRSEVEDLDSYAESYSVYKMDAQLSQWLEEAEVVRSEALEQLDVAEFYARYVTWQQAYVEQLNSVG